VVSADVGIRILGNPAAGGNHGLLVVLVDERATFPADVGHAGAATAGSCAPTQAGPFERLLLAFIVFWDDSEPRTVSASRRRGSKPSPAGR
jgi:hypothetical protein